MSEFKFPMSARVEIVTTGNEGEVVGRAEYEDVESMYLVRYYKVDGCVMEVWITESALRPWNKP